MNHYSSIIKADFKQRTRSHLFLVTLLATVFVAFSFLPGNDADYTTVRIGNYIGYDNAAWIGHVIAIMTSVFLWLVGFYIINNGIRRDRETGVGQIIASTSISNYSYLLAKSLSNFFILLTITAVIVLMALGFVVYRGHAWPFDGLQFFLPFLSGTLPALFFVSVLAVFLEVVFKSKTNLLNGSFFILFILLIANSDAGMNPSTVWLDVLGIKYLTGQIVLFVNSHVTNSPQNLSVGFIFNGEKKPTQFLFEGSSFSFVYILSRLVWVGISFGLLAISARLFDRFDLKIPQKQKAKKLLKADSSEQQNVPEIRLSHWAKATTNYSIVPLVRTEMKLLWSYGPPWFWLVNIGGFMALFFIPLNIAHTIALPILWFLQVNRWANLSTKEKHFGTDSFIFSTYKPLQRLLSAQLLAGILLALLFALPVMLRYLFNADLVNVSAIFFGAVMLISFSVLSGIIFGGKRFFEIVFFMISYAIVQRMPFADYLGCFQSGYSYLSIQVISCILFILLAFAARRYELNKR